MNTDPPQLRPRITLDGWGGPSGNGWIAIASTGQTSVGLFQLGSLHNQGNLSGVELLAPRKNVQVTFDPTIVCHECQRVIRPVELTYTAISTSPIKAALRMYFDAAQIPSRDVLLEYHLSVAFVPRQMVESQKIVLIVGNRLLFY